MSGKGLGPLPCGKHLETGTPFPRLSLPLPKFGEARGDVEML